MSASCWLCMGDADPEGCLICCEVSAGLVDELRQEMQVIWEDRRIYQRRLEESSNRLKRADAKLATLRSALRGIV